jgi:hypothetical protein
MAGKTVSLLPEKAVYTSVNFPDPQSRSSECWRDIAK